MLDNIYTTAIGSLNTIDPTKAVEYSLKHDLPFLPQLPKVDGTMVEQLKTKSYSCLLGLKKKNLKRLKIQIPGPLSSNTDIIKLIDYYEWLKSHFSCDLVTFIDEPYFPKVTREHKQLIQHIKKDSLVGIHCCGEIPINDISKINIDILSFDTSIERVQTNIPVETLALGILPTDKHYHLPDLFPVLDHYKSYNKKILLTPACGLSAEGLNIEQFYSDLEQLKLRLIRV